MKFTDPTNEELNVIFAHHVAKMTPPVSPEGKWIDNSTNQWADVPDYTQSMDAVLPWVNKWRDRPYLYRLMQIDAPSDGWEFKIAQPNMEGIQAEYFWRVKDKSLPRACVIALLRAHGVEVEFTE